MAKKKTWDDIKKMAEQNSSSPKQTSNSNDLVRRPTVNNQSTTQAGTSIRPNQATMWQQIQIRSAQLNERNRQIEQAQKQQQQTQQTQTINPSTNVNMLNNLSSAGVGKTNLSQTRVQQATNNNQTKANNLLPTAKNQDKYGKGNIDLTNRPVVKNEDGSISTVRSMSFYDDSEKKEILIPTVVNGKVVSDKEAILHYYDTGEYLGKFNSVKEADKYAKELHNKQDRLYSTEKQVIKDIKPKDLKKQEKQVKKEMAEKLYDYDQEKRKEKNQKELADSGSIAETIAIKAKQSASDLVQKPQALYDGFQPTDIQRITKSTAQGAVAHGIEGVKSLGDMLGKTFGYGVATVKNIAGDYEGAEKWRQATQASYKEQEDVVNKLNSLWDKNSALGETSNKAIESATQSKSIGAIGGLGKGAQHVTTYLMGASGGLEEAYQEENTDGWEALLKMHGSGISSLISENIFENPLTDYGGTKLTKSMEKKFGEQFTKGVSSALAKLGFSAVGEGAEEVIETVLNKKVVNQLINQVIGEEKYDEKIDYAELTEEALLSMFSVAGGGAPSAIASTVIQNNIQNKIQNSNLSDKQKEGLSKIAQENNLTIQDVNNIIEDTLGTENAQVEEKQPATMENKPISENEQQTTQAEQKEAEIKSSGDIEQDAESINQELSKTLDMMKDLDKYFKNNDIDSKNVKKILKDNGIESTQQLDNLIESQENAIKADQKAIQDSKDIKKAKKASGEEISELDKNSLKKRKESLKADTERLEVLKSVKERVEKSEVRANKKMLNEEKTKLLEKKQPAKLPEKQTNVVDENTVEKNVKKILKDNGFSSEAPLNMAIEKQEQLKASNEEKLKNSDSEGYKEYYQKEIAKIDERLNEYKEVKRQIGETRNQTVTQEQTTQLDETGLNSAQFKEQAKEYNELQKQENELEKTPPKPKKEYVKELNKEQQEKRNAVLKRIGITEEQWNKTDADTKEIIYDIDEVTDEEKRLLNKKIETEDSLKATKGWEDLSKTIETKNSKIQNKLVELNKKMRDTITKEFADIKVTDKLGEKTNRKEFEGFDITKSSLNKEEYLDKDKAKKDGYNYVEIVEMSPEEYLASCAKNEGVGIDEVLAGIDRPQNIVNYAERMLNGEKAPMPYLDLKTHGQEGRHRALSAKLAGIDKIPVLILSDKDFSNRVSQLNETQNKDYNKMNKKEINNEFRRIQEEGSRLSNDERELLFGDDKTRIYQIRENIRGLLQEKLESNISGSNDNKRTVKNPVTKESVDITEVNARDFHDAFEVNRAYMKNPDTVDIHEIEDYKNGKAYLANDGMSGFYISEDGDLQSVFNNSGKAGFLQTIADMVKTDAKTLDCFQNDRQPLGDLYADTFGFKVASIMDFSEEFMRKEKGDEYTDNFIKKYGKAPVYFMVNTEQDVETKHFNEDQWDDAKNYQMSFVNNTEDTSNLEEDVQAFREETNKLLSNETKRQRSLPVSSLDNPDLSTKMKRETKKSLIGTEIGEYIVQTNKKTMDKASDDLTKTASGYDDNYTSFRTKVANDEKISLNDMAKGLLMIQHFDSIGDIEKAQNILKDMSVIATETGQVIQILSLMKKTLPQARVETARRVIERYNKRHGTNIKFNEELARKVNEAKGDKAKDKAMNALLKDAIDQTKLTLGEKLDNWRYMVMLGSPKTWIKNDGGNTLNRQIYKLKNFTKGIMEDIVGAFNKNYVKDTTIKPATKDQKTFAKLRAETLGKDIDTSGSKYSNTPENQMKALKRKFNSKRLNAMAEGVESILDKADTRALVKMYENAFAHYMSANNLSSEDLTVLSTDEHKTIKKKQQQLAMADRYATQQAREATFHQANALASWLNNLDRTTEVFGKEGADMAVRAVGTMAKGLMPFRRTPLNMISQSLAYSPVGLMRGMTGFAKDALTQGKKLQQQLQNNEITQDEYNYEFSNMINNRLDQIAKGINGGIGGVIMGFALSSLGILSVGNLDDDDKYEEKLGKQKYSLNILGHSFSLDFLSPAITPLFYGAEFYNALQEDPDAGLLTLAGTAMRRGTNVLYNTTMLSSLNNAFTYSDGLDDAISTAFSSYFGQFIPSIATNFVNTITPNRKDLSSSKTGIAGDVEYGINKVANLLPEKIEKIPILNKLKTRGDLPDKVDAYGNITQQGGLEDILTDMGLPENEAIGFVSRAIENFMLPTNIKEIESDKTTKELLRLHRESDAQNILKTSGNAPKDFTSNKVKYKLDKNEQSKAKETYGKAIKENLDALINTTAYSKITDDTEKAEIINKVYDYAREKVKAEYMSRNKLPYKSTDDTYNTITAIEKAGGKAKDYFDYMINTKDKDTVGKIDYLQKMSVSQKVKDAIYQNDTATYTYVSSGDDDNYNTIQTINHGKVNSSYLEYKKLSKEKYFSDTDSETGEGYRGRKRERVEKFLKDSDLTNLERSYIYVQEGYAKHLTNTERENLIKALENNKSKITEKTYDSIMKKLNKK